jgi:HlyD family secretion protein
MHAGMCPGSGAASLSSGARAKGRRGWNLLVLLLALLVGACARDNGDLVLVGSVERTLIELAAPASEVIVSVPVQKGSRVAPGDLVVQLDRAIGEAEVAAAEATLAGARSNSVVAEHDLSRARDLRRQKIASEEQFERAELGQDQASAKLREAEARLSVARKRLADLSLVAPVAGVVDQIPFDRGERVPAGAVLAVILQDEEPWVRVWIPERAWSRVSLGTRATVRIDGMAAPLHGRIVYVAREPEFTPHYALTERERAHLVYQARVVLDDAPPALRPGVPADVVISLPAAAGPSATAAHGG